MQIIILLILSGSLLVPYFDKLDKGAEGYFNTLMKEIVVADEGGEGEFSLWQEIDEEEMDFFLIYFGDKYTFAFDDRTFLSAGSENILCICYWDGEEGVCDYCENLKYPVKYDEKYDPWIVASEKLLIKKSGDSYEFVKVEK